MSKLVDMLNTGSVSFSFKKKDGTVRKMIGTRNLKLIPKDAHPVTGNDNSNKELKAIPVFDLEAMAWRSYSVGSDLSVDFFKRA